MEVKREWTLIMTRIVILIDLVGCSCQKDSYCYELKPLSLKDHIPKTLSMRGSESASWM
jgi:hypothetical protein